MSEEIPPPNELPMGENQYRTQVGLREVKLWDDGYAYCNKCQYIGQLKTFPKNKQNYYSCPTCSTGRGNGGADNVQWLLLSAAKWALLIG